MPASVEHKVAMHDLARLRVLDGRPAWRGEVRLAGIFHDETITFAERRDRIVAALRASSWFRHEGGEDTDLWYAVDELADTIDVDEFDTVWDGIYDMADYARVWIETS